MQRNVVSAFLLIVTH